jgi:hypothetical protein
MSQPSVYTIQMHFPMRNELRVLLLLCLAFIVGCAFAQEPFEEYLRRSANPELLGLRDDGRYYPYASPVGRRIGYRQEVAEKRLYRDGWSKAEALESFNRQIVQVENAWREKLSMDFGRKFDELPKESRELLVDFGVSEGIDNVKPEFIKAALDLDWKRLLDPNIYVRYELAWPHTERNKAYYDRWSGKVLAK